MPTTFQPHSRHHRGTLPPSMMCRGVGTPDPEKREKRSLASLASGKPMLLTRILSHQGLLPYASDPWPPPVRPLTLPGHTAVAVIRPAEPPASPMTLELAGLPRPDGGELVVPIER